MEDILINLGVGALLAILSDPSKRGRWRRAILKIFRAASVHFKDDADFRAAALSMED